MSYQKYIKPAVVVILIISAFALGIAGYKYLGKQTVFSDRLIDPLGKELSLGYYTITDSQDYAHIAFQLKNAGKDLNGYYIESYFETNEGVRSLKISIGGDTKDAFVLIFKQDSNLFYPQGKIQYEKLTQEETIKLLNGNKKSMSLILPLKGEGLASAGFSQSFIENGVTCNKNFMEDLKKNSLSISCRPFVLQVNIQK